MLSSPISIYLCLPVHAMTYYIYMNIYVYVCIYTQMNLRLRSNTFALIMRDLWATQKSGSSFVFAFGSLVGSFVKRVTRDVQTPVIPAYLSHL